MYIIIPVALIILTLILSFSNKFKEFRKEHSDFFSFILTFFSTFVGVFLAIFFTNQTEFEKEEKNVLQYLDAANSDIAYRINKTKITYDLAKNGADSMYSTKKHIENNPLQLPNIYQTATNSDYVLRHLSNRGMQEFNVSLDNLISLQRAANEGKAKNDSILLVLVSQYTKQLEHTQKIILLEKEKIEFEISEDSINKKYNIVVNELIGEGQHNIKTAIEEQKAREKNYD